MLTLELVQRQRQAITLRQMHQAQMQVGEERARAQSYRGNNSMRDYARAQDGGPGIHIRTFSPITQSFDYTRAGRAWPWWRAACQTRSVLAWKS